jgi:hypothetical protein
VSAVVTPVLSALTRRAITPAGGFALQNGVPTIITWTTPNDGQPHRFQVSAAQNVTVAETAGAVQITYTDPAGNPATVALFPGASGAGAQYGSADRLAAPNTAISVAQSSALTAGAASVWADLIAL